MKEYFSKDDNIEKIIKSVLPQEDITNIKYISNGWTNFVYLVSTRQNNYFFRFPRDIFWAKAIIKECAFSKFIEGKTSYNTSVLDLHKDINGRYFSVHKKIEGETLAEVMNDLNSDEIQKISSQISDFMYQLHTIKLNKNIEEITNLENIELLDFLNELLTMHILKKDMYFWNISELKQNNYCCLVHGDLNSSNILLDKDNNVGGIIDWAFAGFGNKYDDIARIIGRCTIPFKSEIIREYEILENQKINTFQLEKEIIMWDQIDNSYINYMKRKKII